MGSLTSDLNHTRYLSPTSSVLWADNKEYLLPVWPCLIHIVSNENFMQTCNGEHCLQFSVLIYPHRLSNAKFYHSYILKMESVDTKRKVDPYFSISVIVVVARQQPVQQHHSPSSCEFGLQLQKHSTFCLPSSGSGNDWTLLFLASESESSWFVLQRKCCALSKRKKMANHWCLDNPIDHNF